MKKKAKTKTVKVEYIPAERRTSMDGPVARRWLHEASVEEISDALLSLPPEKAAMVITAAIASAPRELERAMAELENMSEDDPARLAGKMLGGMIKSFL